MAFQASTKPSTGMGMGMGSSQPPAKGGMGMGMGMGMGSKPAGGGMGMGMGGGMGGGGIKSSFDEKFGQLDVPDAKGRAPMPRMPNTKAGGTMPAGSPSVPAFGTEKQPDAPAVVPGGSGGPAPPGTGGGAAGGAATDAALTNRAATAYRPGGGQKDPITATLKACNGILNKLTPRKYDTLVQQMKDTLFEWKLGTEDESAKKVLSGMITLVFEKALSEATFSNMYAELCKQLCDEAMKREKGEGAEIHKQFRTLLLERCQAEFEKQGDGSEVNDKTRKRSTANVKFVAELFTRKMLTEKIMHAIIKRLLYGPEGTAPRGKQKLHAPPSEDVEVLSKLWVTAGSTLDREVAKEQVDQYFQHMQRLTKEHPENRIRFMLMDTCDLRKANWKAREVKVPETE